MSDRTEYDNFDQLMRKLIKVPHSKIKAKLEEEKANKASKNKRTENRPVDKGKNEASDTFRSYRET